MSRLGNKPIALSSGVDVTVSGTKVTVKGPKGALDIDIEEGIAVKKEGEELIVSLEEGTKLASAKHGLYWSLIGNGVEGVTKGFEKQLKLIGVGYRAAVKGKVIDLQLGFSHPNELPIPEGIEVKVNSSTDIIISGADKQKVGQFAADIRAVRPPEPYKGKGVRYVDEYVRKKAGKAAKGK